MAALLWPMGVLPPRNILAEIASRSLAGPASVSGATQVVASDAGIWKVTYDQVPIFDAQRILAWRGISNLLEGRLGAVLVPLTRDYQPVITEPEGLYDPVPHSDGAFFSDGSGYVGSTISVSLASGIAARSVSAIVNIAYGGTLQPGQHFSIGERGYRLRTVVYTDDDTATVTFRPPLREAAVAGTRLEFDEPVVRMRLASDAEMDMQLDYNRWAFPSVNFIEDV